MKPTNTSWQNSAKIYHKSLGVTGDYFHQSVINPRTQLLLNLKSGDSLLDLACGQGVLARSLPSGVRYLGVDIAESLIELAKKMNKNAKAEFLVRDVTKPLFIKEKFSHAVIMLALQNLKFPKEAIKNASDCLLPKGKLIVVINHPCFRIPRQSSWQVDEQNKIEYRRINRYLSPLEVPIKMEPSKGEQGEITWTYHFSLSDLSKMLSENGFLIEKIEEWVSEKESQGRASRMENRARAEFPMFLAISAVKGI